MLERLKRLLRIWAGRPVIDVRRSGWATDNPAVIVSAVSRYGSMTLSIHDDDERGNARASLSAKALGHITGLPIQDERKET